MSDTPRTEAEILVLTQGLCHIEVVTALYARQLERELNTARFHLVGMEAIESGLRADIDELLERLRERTEAHLAASARGVQTIQQQSLELDSMKRTIQDVEKILQSIVCNDIFEDTMRNHALLAVSKLQPSLKL